MSEADSVPAGTEIKTRFLRVFGGTSSGLGALGAACHYSCQAIVALLAIAGISVAGMPLAFLAEPRLVILFSALGLASVAFGIWLHLRMKRRFDWKIAVFALFAVVSTVSLGFGVRDLVAGQDPAQTVGAAEMPAFSVDAVAKTSEAGDVTIEISYEGVSKKEMVFRVAMDVMRMDLPPLTEFDLQRLARLVAPEGTEVTPSRWSVEDGGHMGHHVRGTLVFPLTTDVQPIIDGRAKSFEIVLNDVAGVKERVFAWEIVPAAG